MAKSGIDWIQMQFKRNNLPGFFHGDKLLGTGLTFWFILNGGVALILFSPMSCMSLFEFATPQLWQDYVKNMPLWVSKELWHSKECIRFLTDFLTDVIPILTIFTSNRYWYRYLIYSLFQTYTNYSYILTILIPIPVSAEL